MIEVKPGVAGKVEVTFIVPPNGLRAPISLVGDFNGWDPAAHPLSFRGLSYRAALVVDIGRRYAFRYRSGCEQWFNDDDADDYQPNAFGGHDSVLDLTLADPGVDLTHSRAIPHWV